MNYNGFYQTEWGWFFKDKFMISSEGIEYNKNHIYLEEITGISWKINTLVYNGIFRQTNYEIKIETKNNSFYIRPSKEKIFNNIVNNIWQAVGNNLMVKMILKLQNGETLRIGQIEFTDLGIFLENNKFFSSDRKFFTWNEDLTIYSENGSVIISSKSENYSSSVPYDAKNVPVFENLIRIFFKNFDYSNPRISSLLQ